MLRFERADKARNQPFDLVVGGDPALGDSARRNQHKFPPEERQQERIDLALGIDEHIDRARIREFFLSIQHRLIDLGEIGRRHADGVA